MPTGGNCLFLFLNANILKNRWKQKEDDFYANPCVRTILLALDHPVGIFIGPRRGAGANPEGTAGGESWVGKGVRGAKDTEAEMPKASRR